MKELNKINLNRIELNRLRIRFFTQGNANIEAISEIFAVSD